MVVSVIIPLYNGEKFIRKTIQSILNQTYKDVEIIIVDDCSTDNSKEVIFNEFGGLIGKKIIYVRNQENMERSYTRNRGFEVSKGEYVFFLDADDEWEEDYIESSLKELEKYHIVYSVPRTFIDQDSKVIRVSKKRIPEDVGKLIFSGQIGYPSASAFRREAFLGYREDVLHREDWEIYIRSYLSGLKIKVVDNNKVRIREHPYRSSKNMRKFFLATMKVYQEYKEKVPLEYKKDFLFHMADISFRVGNLPLGWKFFFESLSLEVVKNPRNLLTLLKRGFRIDRYVDYLKNPI